MDIDILEREGQKFINVALQNETVRSEAGALHYFRGDIEMESKAPSSGGIFSSIVSGETIFKPTYSGTGDVYFGPPHFGEYQILELNGEEWILNQGAYVCSGMGIEVSAFRNKATAALFGGEGLYQTSVKGTGPVVIEAPGKLQKLELQGERLAVDGRFAVARTAGVDFSVERASKGLVGSVTSGEGLVNMFQGRGIVLMAPVPNLYQNLITSTGHTVTRGTAGEGDGSDDASVGEFASTLILVAVLVGAVVLLGVLMAVLG